jgi:hypothetical protein
MAHVVAKTLTAEQLNAQDASNRSKVWMKDWQLNNPKDITDFSRYRCFLEISTKAEGLLVAERSNLGRLRLPTPKFGMQGVVDSRADWHHNLYHLLCLPYMKELAHVLRDQNQKYFVVAFDECSYVSRRPLWDIRSSHCCASMAVQPRFRDVREAIAEGQ